VNNNTFQPPQEEEGFDFKALLTKLYTNWYYIVLSVLIALSVAYIYNKYLVPSYSVTTSIFLKGKSGIGTGLEILIAEEGSGESSNPKGIDDELTKLKSSRMMEQVIDSLNLHISYYAHGKFNKQELYKKSPFLVSVNYDKIPDLFYGNHIYLTPLSRESYILELPDDELIFNHQSGAFEPIANTSKEQTQMLFGRKYALDSCFLSIDMNEGFSMKNEAQKYSFLIQQKEILAESLSRKLDIKKAGKSSAIVHISTEGKVIVKEVDILNKLVKVYTVNSLREKNQVLYNTLKFIDDQIAEVSDTLKIIEEELNHFRKSNRLMSVASVGTEAFGKLKQYEEEKIKIIEKRRYYVYLRDYLNHNDPLEKIVAPSLIGINEPLISQLIAELVGAASERNKMSLYQEPTTKTWQKMDSRISLLKKEVLEVIKNNLNNSELEIRDLDARYLELEKEALILPDKEREFLNIERKLKIREGIYTYLLQKRTEIGMSKAGSVPDVSVIGEAKPRNASMIGLKKTEIYGIAALIGLLLPCLLLYLSLILNDKLQSKKEIERLTQIPVIGMIGHNRRNQYLVVNENPKSIITESFRSTRLNLTYFAPNKKNKIIGVTSSVSGEGKTFFTMNLAAVYALAGKKTVVIMADLRKPKYEVELGLNLSKGLSTYLTGQSTYEESVQTTNVANLDIVPAGPIPPNPAETLGLPTMEELIERLRLNYEYIIIDTPPLGLLADWFIISPFIDAGIYIVRHNYTRKSLLRKINDLYKEKKVPNMSIVINDIGQKSAGYGYGYGSYGYDYDYSYFEKPETTFQKILKFFKNKKNKK
jgi:capsular exopolysaccharide synthesis family protein